MSRQVWLAGAVAAVVLGSVPAGSQPAPIPPPAPAPAGYLLNPDLPDSLVIVPPPPAPGSSAQARDDETAKVAIALHGGPRWDLATEDSVLAFPAAAGTFSCTIGTTISEADTPTLYRLLRRSYSDLGRSPYPTKNKYKRARPFTVNGKPQCTPALDAALRADGSYPSGHAAIGYGWGLIMAEVAPDKATAAVARGRVFSQSRSVCNVHWQSDVDEGRIMASAVVARLHDNADFRADVAAAKTEVAAARARGLKPTRDCAKETAQVAAGGGV